MFSAFANKVLTFYMLVVSRLPQNLPVSKEIRSFKKTFPVEGYEGRSKWYFLPFLYNRSYICPKSSLKLDYDFIFLKDKVVPCLAFFNLKVGITLLCIKTFYPVPRIPF